MARPPKLTPEIGEKIVQLIRTGNYRETAAAAAGISRNTLRNWMKWGAMGKEPYVDFAAKLDEAEAAAEAHHVLRITSASKEDWRAAAWILSRKYSQRWGDKVQVEIQEQIEGIFQIIEDVLGEESAARVFEAVSRRSREPAPEQTEGQEQAIH